MTGADYGRAFESIFKLLKWFAISSVVFVPLGIWKLIEIVLWII